MFLLCRDEMLMFHFQRGGPCWVIPLPLAERGSAAFQGPCSSHCTRFSLGREMHFGSWGLLLPTAEITSKNILPVQADRCKEGAEENPSVRVALPGQQGQPAGGLLDHLRHGLVLQQVGDPHLGVADIVAQGHAVRDGRAAGGSPQVAGPGARRAPEQQPRQETQQPRATRPPAVERARGDHAGSELERENGLRTPD